MTPTLGRVDRQVFAFGVPLRDRRVNLALVGDRSRQGSLTDSAGPYLNMGLHAGRAVKRTNAGVAVEVVVADVTF